MSIQWRVVISAAVVVAVQAGCTVTPEWYPSTSGGERAECRHSPDPRESATAAVREFTGAHANVPEFHDCQRLIENVDGELRYGVLMAVYAPPGSRMPREAPDTSGATMGRTIALVHRPDAGSNIGTYEPLGITETLNDGCVVVTDTVAYLHRIEIGEVCLATYGLRELISQNATRLSLVRHATTELPAQPVARWGFDQSSKTHYIGATCPGGWCMIVSTDEVRPDSDYDTPPGDRPPAYGPVGSDDWQFLAEEHLTENGEMELRPSLNIGRVAPHEDMNAAQEADYHGSWVRSAVVSITSDTGSYGRKFGFVASDDLSWGATISICYSDSTATCRPSSWRRFKAGECLVGDASSAGAPQQEWYARVESPGAPTRYFCVQFREHHHTIATPPLTRWRWLPDDETVWVRCPYGCCEVAVITKQGQ